MVKSILSSLLVIGLYVGGVRGTDCTSCTLAQLNALKGTGTGYYTQGGVLVQNGCNVCGWSCNGTGQAPYFTAFQTDLKTSIIVDKYHCGGYINNDNYEIFKCNAAGKWTILGKPVGKYTCNKGPCVTTTTKAPTTTPKPCFTHHAPSTTYANCAAVGSGFIDVGGSCYRSTFVNATFAGARSACKALHPAADLATIRCASENSGALSNVPAAVKTKCQSFGEYFHSQMLVGIANVSSPVGRVWANGANTAFRNWAPAEPNGDFSTNNVATMYIFSPNPSGGVAYPVGQWENLPPSWRVCAALCEVITAKSGTGCGMEPCAGIV